MTHAVEPTLVLFDIDGTLLDTHGAGRRSFARAITAVFGWQDDLGYIQFAGATDLDVLARIAARHGVALAREQEQAFLAHLPRELERTLRDTTPTPYPGVRDLLGALAADPRALLGIVTGNIESCARIKLESIGLHDHFVLGAFGHEHAERSEIARLAAQRAAASLPPGQRVAASFLVGDTPSDIAAARAIGAASIAVATGTHTRAQLHDAGADHVLDDLGDTPALLALLGLAACRPYRPTHPASRARQAAKGKMRN